MNWLPHRNHSPTFKRKVAVANLRSDAVLAETGQSARCVVHPDYRVEGPAAGSGIQGARYLDRFVSNADGAEFVIYKYR